MRRLLSAALVAGIASVIAVAIATAHEDRSTDQWPLTCVDLNDIVEEHLGNPHNVGIYQNTFGDQAEAVCRNDHRNDVIAVFGWAVAEEAGASSSDLELDWPTTCVELNDIVEGHLGNPHNVGIYQNTFGDQAEAACQNDHRNDVIAVFGWAIATDAGVPTSESTKRTLVFSDLNWNSAQIQNRVAQYIVEKGYGYPTDVVFGALLPLFQELRRGDSHITLEIWLPTQDEAWDEAVAAGEVVSIGLSLGKHWQSAFVIPKYLQEQYPELDNVEDLKEEQFKKLFQNAETGDKARLVSCVIGWACEEVNAAQVEAYGLSEHVEIVNPDDGAAANADLYGAYERGDPWLGYQWGTNDPALVLDLVRLEEPPYSDECWWTTKACGYQDATILIAVHPSVMTDAPDVVEMLRAWSFNIAIYKGVAAWLQDHPDASPEDAALWWLNGNAGVWGQWVTEEAAAAIQAALDANEIPEGWPEE